MDSMISLNASVSYKRIRLIIFSFVFVNSVVICQLPVCSDSWVATDALGRKLPGIEEAGKADDNSKQVGIFYWTWHTDNKADFSPIMNISQILEKYPEAAQLEDHFAWKNIRGGVFWWEESIFGYYRTTDDWVLYKHAQMLTNAKIDVVIFDATNGTQTWKSSYTRLLEVWNKARLYGMKVPKIAFMLGFSPNQLALTAIEELYHELYKPALFPEMWYLWEGKPLIMAYYEMLEEYSGEENEDKLRQEIRNFFTFRPCQPDYVDGPSKNDQWSWLEIYPQNGYGLKSDGSYEEMSVGVAQNASKKSGGKWHAFNDDGTFGRSYTFSHGQDTSKNAFLKGINFQEQWNRALEINPDFIFVTGWNEWTAGRHINYDLPTVKSFQPFAFVDQYNWEKSRDTEPVKAWGDHADNYYMQLIANIRKFKGLNIQNEPVSAVTKDGVYQWSEYSDYQGDVMWREHPGQGDSLHYTNQTGRNDILKCSVASDENNILFTVESATELTSKTDKGWMRLFIDIDRDKSTGWQGYDFVLNRNSPTNVIAVEKSLDRWDWFEVGAAPYKLTGKTLEVEVKKTILGLTRDESVNLEFKWSDNMQEDANIIDFYINGDTAPDGRFNYLYTDF